MPSLLKVLVLLVLAEDGADMRPGEDILPCLVFGGLTGFRVMGSEAGSYLRLIDFVFSLNSRLNSRHMPSLTAVLVLADAGADMRPGEDILPCFHVSGFRVHVSGCMCQGVGSGLEQKMLKGHLPRVMYHQVY